MLELWNNLDSGFVSVNDPNAPVDYMTPAPAMSTTETTSQGVSWTENNFANGFR